MYTSQSITSTKQLYSDLQTLRQDNPVVHNVTNLVVMQTTANVLLAIGASPIMAHAITELTDIAAISRSLVLNIGTLDGHWVDAMLAAQKAAKLQKIPVILDPVGAGATAYRTDIAKQILTNGVDIVRGNASEIMALMETNIKSKGVDSLHQSTDAITAAKTISEKHHCVVVISGKTDIVVSSSHLAYIHHGSSLFTKVTGMGCAATAVIGAFAAINANYFLAATHAMTIFSIAGEIAEKQCQGPGSFYVNLLDALFNLKVEQFNHLQITS